MDQHDTLDNQLTREIGTKVCRHIESLFLKGWRTKDNRKNWQIKGYSFGNTIAFEIHQDGTIVLGVKIAVIDEIIRATTEDFWNKIVTIQFPLADPKVFEKLQNRILNLIQFQ